MGRGRGRYKGINGDGKDTIKKMFQYFNKNVSGDSMYCQAGAYILNLSPKLENL